VIIYFKDNKIRSKNQCKLKKEEEEEEEEDH
jgi:hypothetical protein